MHRVPTLSENPLLNGNFDNFPDSTSLTAAGKLGVTWTVEALGTSGAATISRQAFTIGQTAVPGEPTYFLRWAHTTAATAGTPALANRIESVRTFAGRRVLVQFWYRANAAFTVGMRQSFGSGGSPSADVDLTALNVPSTVDSAGTAQWAPMDLVFTLGSISGKTLGSTANTDYLALRYLWPLSTTFQVDLQDVRISDSLMRNPYLQRRRGDEEQVFLARYYDTYALYAPVSTQSANGLFHRRPMRVAPTMAGTGATYANITADSFSVISAGAAASVTVTSDARL